MFGACRVGDVYSFPSIATAEVVSDIVCDYFVSVYLPMCLYTFLLSLPPFPLLLHPASLLGLFLGNPLSCPVPV
jgi:hypothetical protein